jgi:ATP-dependent protease ClpP protease subunit
MVLHNTPKSQQAEGMPMMDKPMYSQPVAYKHELHLKGPVTDPEDYVEWNRLIRSAGPNDTIEFHINSPGGNVYSATELINSFLTTDAHIHVVLSGIVASAGTILMMVGDSFEIAPHTTFMFHNYSGGTIGKGNEMHVKMEYEREWSKEFMHDVYMDLLSEEEINQLLDGRDFWLSSDEIGERLQSMAEKRAEKMEEALAEAKKLLEAETKPKRKPRAKKEKTDAKSSKRATSKPKSTKK